MKIKWKRSDEGFVESYKLDNGSWFEITPLYMGRVNAQAYNLYKYYPDKKREKITGMVDTQKECKEIAEHYKENKQWY